MRISITAYDLVVNEPAVELTVALHVLQESGEWLDLGTMPTDEHGQIGNMVSRFFRPKPGMYRLSFATSAYFGLRQAPTVLPVIPVVLQVDDVTRDFDVELHLSRGRYTMTVA